MVEVAFGFQMELGQRKIHTSDLFGTAECLLEEAKTVADGVCQLTHVRHQALHIFLVLMLHGCHLPETFPFQAQVFLG